jgi:hypothetical protein
MSRFVVITLASNLFGFATIGLFGGSLICLIMSKGDLSGKLALGGLFTAASTVATLVYASKNMVSASKDMMDKVQDFFGDK